jgi:hypothetical protein
MSETLTSHITNNSINSVRKMINKKQRSDPFYATESNIANVITDMDHFPYTRFYRGRYDSTNPIVFEREAGWRPNNNTCYTPNYTIPEQPYPNHCFSGSCSVVFPCYPEYQTKYADKESLDIQLNSACVVQYR